MMTLMSLMIGVYLLVLVLVADSILRKWRKGRREKNGPVFGGARKDYDSRSKE